MDIEDFNKEFWYCLALHHCKGLGPQKWKRLLDFYGDAKTAVDNVNNWLKDDIVEPLIFENFQKKQWTQQAKQEFEQIQKMENKILLYSDPNYPEQLRQIPDPPLFLYYQGNLDLLKSPCIAIVGSRTCSDYGLNTAGHFSSSLSNAGITVVSGFALGIDGRAHSSALQASGKSIAVLGTGLDVPYPNRNNQLRESMLNHGLLLTEFSPKTQPEPRNFPRRNRIISGLSLGVLVIEAGEKSGSLITARYALEQNRDVFAVPGPVNAPSYQGCNKLIQQGALLVNSPEDILQELAPILKQFNNYSLTDTPQEENNNIFQQEQSRIANREHSGLPPTEQELARIIANEKEIHIDALSRQLDWEPGKVSQILLKLEMKGIVRQLPGMYYCPAAPSF